MSMYRQLWLAIVLSTLLAVCGSLLVSLLSARSYLEEQLSIKNTDNATALALSLSQGKPDAVMVDLVVASMFDGGHYEYIRIADPFGVTIAQRDGFQAVGDAPAWFVRLLPIHAQPGRAQISDGWKQFGTVVLMSHSRFAYAALWKSAYEMTAALAAAGLLGGYLGSLVLARIRRPLMHVIEQAKAITQRRFVTIQEPKVPELSALAAAMNAMVGRLKSMFDDEAARLEELRRRANFDELTGLANRSHFLLRLHAATESDESVGGTLILLRLSDLAGVHRRLRREVTDEYLRAMSSVVAAAAAKADMAVAARLNGADFALLLPGEHDTMAVAIHLRDALVLAGAPYVDGETTLSVGVGRFVRPTDTSALLARVDAALAAAERNGGNDLREMPVDTLDEMPRTSDQWASMIQRALGNGWVKLTSFPVVTATGQLLHREYPLRLMFDEGGPWLPAGRFLPAAERLKLTAALDMAAVRLGLEELQAQPQLPGVAINLSGSSLEDAHFLPTLSALLTSQRNVATRLWLEVSEVGALKHLEALSALCVMLKAHGCRLGLEHFGHQFSHIGVLHKLGLDYLKVDASFVRDLESNVGNAAFLKGLCSIAHNIGLQVLAEGVTKQEELVALMEAGFDGATGPGVVEPQA